MGSAASVVKQSYDITKRQYMASKVLPKLMAVGALERIKSGILRRTGKMEAETDKQDHRQNEKKRFDGEDMDNNEDECPIEEKMTKEEIGQLVREAQVLMDRGGEVRLEQARSLFEQVVEGREKLLGPFHANTLKSMTVLGSILYKLKKLNAARCQYEKALDGYEQVFGIENRDTLNCMNSLAEILQELGQEFEATNVFIKCLAGKESLYGDHESTFNTANHLANLFKKSRRTAEARDVYVKALRGKEKVLGDNHPSTINATVNLAGIQKQLGNLKEAIELYERALQKQEEIYGLQHENTLVTIKNLHHLLNLNSVNRKEEANMLMERVGHSLGRSRDTILGTKRPTTISNSKSTASSFSSIAVSNGKEKEVIVSTASISGTSL